MSTQVLTIACEACGHRHNDTCDAAMVDEGGVEVMCSCPPPCGECQGTGDLSVPVSHYADADFDCPQCGGTGRAD